MWVTMSMNKACAFKKKNVNAMENTLIASHESKLKIKTITIVRTSILEKE